MGIMVYTLGEDLMNIIVHLMFAVTLRKRLKKSLGITLNLPGFLYGNILPDISKKYGAFPHYIKDALHHVVTSNEKLLAEGNESLNSYKFAKELGAINHYLSDFFCYPHTEGYSKPKVHHAYYELMMVAHYKKGLRALKILLEKQNSSLIFYDLRAFILENNKKYSGHGTSDVNDIGYALFTGVLMIESVLIQSLATSANIYDNMIKAQAI